MTDIAGRVYTHGTMGHFETGSLVIDVAPSGSMVLYDNGDGSHITVFPCQLQAVARAVAYANARVFNCAFNRGRDESDD